MPPTAGTGGERVFVQLGPPPTEPNQFNHPDAPRTYPPAVRERLAADAAEIVARYPQPKSAILSLLHLVQGEDSYLTPAGLGFVAEEIGRASCREREGCCRSDGMGTQGNRAP